MHDRDEEGRVGQSRIEVKAHEKDLFLHHASRCCAAIGYCQRGRLSMAKIPILSSGIEHRTAVDPMPISVRDKGTSN